MSLKIALLHETDTEHLAAVKHDMQTRGSPTIKAVWMECYGLWVALEGTHRLVAAHELGITPIIDPVDYSEDVTLANIGITQGDTDTTVGRIADDAYAATCLDFA